MPTCESVRHIEMRRSEPRSFALWTPSSLSVITFCTRRPRTRFYSVLTPYKG
jgi:hypothetical protein